MDMSTFIFTGLVMESTSKFIGFEYTE